MPISLTTPYSTGDLDVGDYAEAKISRIDIIPGADRILIQVERGNTVDDVWTPGLDIAHATFTVRDEGAGTDYTDMLNVVPDGVETIYDAIKRVAYQWLLDKGHFAGTIT